MMPINNPVSQSGQLYQPVATNENLSVVASWRIWAQEAKVGSGQRRDEALQRLTACVNNREQKLDLSHLGLTTLPSVWPDWLVILNLHDNQLTWLPNSFPASLRVLRVDGNPLSAQPIHLPPGLQVLQTW